MKAALVYDRITKYGGAERVLEALHEIYPDAPLYTSVYDEKKTSWARNFRVIPSFLNKISCARQHHEFLPALTPIAFESFTFDTFEAVISITSAEAKSIITKPGTLHICYCLTPTRYLWSAADYYQSVPGLGIWGYVAKPALAALLPILRQWDLLSSARPDYIIAISRLVAERIKRYYRREADAVIYPPVRTDFFTPDRTIRQDFFLSVGRFVSYKRFDLLIDVFNETGDKLVLIGCGRDESRLRKFARPNVQFVTHHLTDVELRHYYRQCRGFVFAGEEDFGIVAGEAQSCGTPVAVYKGSGMAETVISGKTGILIRDQSKAAVQDALNEMKKTDWQSKIIRKQAQKFGFDVFSTSFDGFVRKVIRERMKL